MANEEHFNDASIIASGIGIGTTLAADSAYQIMSSAQGEQGEQEQQQEQEQASADDATMRTVDDDDDDDEGDDDDDNASMRTRSYNNMQSLMRQGVAHAAGNSNINTANGGVDNNDSGIDDDDGYDDDGTNYWMTYEEEEEEEEEEYIDPFDVNACKILHFPGAKDCRGRNIVHILDDRSLFGPKFRRNQMMIVGAEQHSDVTAISNVGGDVDGADDDDDGGSTRGGKTGATSHRNQRMSPAPTTPPVTMDPFQHLNQVKNHYQIQEQRQILPSNSNSNNSVAPQTPPAAAATYPFGFGNSSQQVLQQQHRYTPTLYGNVAVGTDNGNNMNASENTSCSNNENNNKHLHPQVKHAEEVNDVTAEIVAYAEYASATKFKASYLDHLNDGADGARRSGGAGFRRRNAARGGGGGDHGEDNESMSNDGGVAESRYTQEQLETNRLLQEHLRMHQHPRQQQQPIQDRRAAGRGDAPATGGGNASNRRGTDNRINLNPDSIYIQQQMEAARRMHQLQRQSMHSTLQPPSHRPRPHINSYNSNDAPATPTKAISTISIAFSPDSRTVASTHGDHTVKISCCHTGKLIRTLEGHPRTPWTVKFHPSNSRIVASGCLGFQVRVWDWNYQKESVRKQRGVERERKWKGRYDFAPQRSSNGNGLGGEWDDVVGTGVLSGGAMGLDSFNNYFGPTSPRGVVDQHPWRSSLAPTTTMREEGDGEKQNMWGFENTSNNRLPAEDDDYAAYILAGAGIPRDDPAWYDTESEAYNYDTGIGVCLNMIRLNSAVISLSFHPSGEVLAMASGSSLHFWDFNEEKRKKERKAAAGSIADGGGVAVMGLSLHPSVSSSVRESESRILNRSETSEFPSSQTVEFRHQSALRCVHFPPCGTVVIVGGVNSPSSNEGLPSSRDARRRGGMNGGGMSFHLRLWDFSLDTMLDPSGLERGASNDGVGRALPRSGRISDEGDIMWDFGGMQEVLKNVSIIVNFSFSAIESISVTFAFIAIPLSRERSYLVYYCTMTEDLIFLKMERFSVLVLNFGYLKVLKALWSCSTVNMRWKKVANSYQGKTVSRRLILRHLQCLEVRVPIHLRHVENKLRFQIHELHLPTIAAIHCSNHLHLLGNVIYPPFHAHYPLITHIRCR